MVAPLRPPEDRIPMMYMLSFQLRTDDPAAREKVETAIKRLGNWSRRLPDLWLVESRSSAPQIRDFLKQQMGAQDALFVARISKNWAGRNMGAGFPEWMKRRDFGTFEGS